MVLLVAAGVYFFDWNLLRDPIARRVEQATGRSFAIRGNVKVRLSLKPRVSAEDIAFGNAAWSHEATMAQIGRVEFTFDVPALLRGQPVFDEIELSDARLLLERDPQGAANWEFGAQKKSGKAPAIRSLRIDRSVISFRDPTLKADVEAEVASVPAGNADEGKLQVRARGRMKGLAGTLEGVVGNALDLESSDKPYPIRLSAVIGATQARVDGVLLEPLQLRGEDLGFDLEGKDLAQIYSILGVPLPPTPPYRLSGHLNHSGSLWQFHKFSGRVGGSDLSGDFSLDLSRKPQAIKANLVSRRLDMQDLGGVIGSDRGTAKESPEPPPPGRVLPQERFNVEKLRVANAQVQFRGEKVLTEKLPLENMATTLKLNDGVLTLEPLAFGVAGGTLDSTIRMDARESVIRTRADIAVKQLHLEKLFPGFKLGRANAGAITGRAKLDTAGNSVATMLGNGDGETLLLMEGGSVSELLVRLVNLDVANALPVLLTGDRQLPVRCMVTRLAGTHGDFKVDTMLLDTGKAVVSGTGEVDFAEEALDLTLVSKSKDFSLAALRGPIRVTGTFKNPSVRPDMKRVAGRGGVAAALGIATGGLGALLPLLDFGGEPDSTCAKVIQEAQSPEVKK